MRRVKLEAGLGVMLLASVALVVGAQGPPPSGGFGGNGPGPMAGMFEFGGVMGGLGGKLVTGKPILASFTITRKQTLAGENSITNTSTGTYARGADGSVYRDTKFTAIGPWTVSGKAREYIYIRNITQGTQFVVNATKGTYQAFPIRGHKAPEADNRNGSSSAESTNVIVSDNPNATYTDPVTNVPYPVDDRKVTRTIPAGAIGNRLDIVITSESWYSDALELLLQETRNDPRFGTTTYQLSNIGRSPSSSLFMPDPSFTQVPARGYGSPGEGKPQSPPS